MEEKGLAPQTVLHFHRLLHEALRQAVMCGDIAVNPADRVTPPKVRRQERKILDKDQTLALIEAARGTHLYMPILLAVATGARRGELLALGWTDCDLKAGTVTIRRTLSETRELGLVFKEPKSKKSTRGNSPSGVRRGSTQEAQEDSSRGDHVYPGDVS